VFGRATAVLAAALVVLLGLIPARPAPAVSLSGDESCEVDGVRADLHTSVGGGDVRASSVRVSRISVTCGGGSLRVVLGAAGHQLGQGTVALPTRRFNGGATVDISPQPRLEDVTSITVEITGGAVPIPAGCSSMSLNAVLIGTTGSDTLTGGSTKDLVYAQQGNDVVRGGSKGDCLVGQDGDDRLDGGTDADGLYGEDGADELTGGPGNDVLDGGPGRDVCISGGGQDTFRSCEVRR
jgi:Ca2+-binding RTX toxin-like protein